MILIIDNYDSFTFNLYQLVESLGYPCQVLRNDCIDAAEILQMNPQALIFSPGPGHPTEAGNTLEILNELQGRFPILGVCLGHQAIGHFFGAQVIRAEKPLHGKVSEVHHDGKGLFAGLNEPFQATRYHSLVIDPSTLPDCLEITAQTSDQTVMGIRHKELLIEGVQFHPESIATENGAHMLQAFLNLRSAS